MFHLTRYRYIFFAVSGAIIVPGLLALIFWHLNLGIDFTNGSTVSLRFQSKSATITSLTNAFKQKGAQDVNVLISTDTTKAGEVVYLEFSRPIGTAFRSQVQTLINADSAKLPGAQEIHYDYVLDTADGQRGQLIYQFSKPVSVADLQSALKNLPQTDAPPAGATSGSSATATPASSATVAPTNTPAPTATAKPSGTATPGGTATPAATATATPSAQTFPVTLTSVNLNQDNRLFEVDTQTDLANTAQDCAASNKICLSTIVQTLQTQFGPVYIVQSSSVGPAIAAETTLFAILAVVAAAVFILIYIAIAFRRVGSFQLSIRFGASAIFALLHDALVVLGLWAIFGFFFNFKVDTLFVTALLTVIGFSVHDTIVVFDRLRENLARHTSESFSTVVDTSLIQTLSRSLNTSLTVLVVLSAEVLFGGASTREFVLALLIGIASGTYSSIFNASMILVVWQNAEYKEWFPRNRRPALQVAGRVPRTPAGVR